jgi:hypothetical protein
MLSIPRHCEESAIIKRHESVLAPQVSKTRQSAHAIT